MARTTADLVKGVLRLGSEGGDYDDAANPSLTPYITWANVLTSRVAAADDAADDVLDDAALEVLETWLAAHAYACSDRTYSYKMTDDAQATFDGRTDKGLKATLYGQQALLLDPTGTLANLDAENRRVIQAGVSWMGKAPRNVKSYDQRNA